VRDTLFESVTLFCQQGRYTICILACHITRSLSGVILKNYDIVKELIESTMTKKGLKVKANIITEVYKTGRKYAENYKEKMQIKFDEKLGKWNYRAVPIKA